MDPASGAVRGPPRLAVRGSPPHDSSASSPSQLRHESGAVQRRGRRSARPRASGGPVATNRRASGRAPARPARPRGPRRGIPAQAAVLERRGLGCCHHPVPALAAARHDLQHADRLVRADAPAHRAGRADIPAPSPRLRRCRCRDRLLVRPGARLATAGGFGRRRAAGRRPPCSWCPRCSCATT